MSSRPCWEGIGVTLQLDEMATKPDTATEYVTEIQEIFVVTDISRTWSFPYHNRACFVPKPNQTVSTARTT